MIGLAAKQHHEHTQSESRGFAAIVITASPRGEHRARRRCIYSAAGKIFVAHIFVFAFTTPKHTRHVRGLLTQALDL
jgi:hypothetical protein